MVANGTLKYETESFVFAALEQAIQTNVIKGKIVESQEQTTCRMCKRADDTINHIVSEYSKHTQREYKRRHAWIGRRIHWEICRANGIHVKSKLYEKDSCKILWSFTVQTDHFITTRGPIIIIIIITIIVIIMIK